MACRRVTFPFGSSIFVFAHFLSAIINPTPPIINPQKITTGENKTTFIKSLNAYPTPNNGTIAQPITSVSLDTMVCMRFENMLDKEKRPQK